MTATAAPTVKDKALVSLGLVESASVNSIADFIPSKSNESKVSPKKQNNDFADNFICHLIFYAFFCAALVLHIFVDLGFGTFLNQNFQRLNRLVKKYVFKNGPALA